MSIQDEMVELASIIIDGQYYDLTVQVWFDGTRYAGRLWFTGMGATEPGIPGRRLFIGRTRDEAIDRVRQLTQDELRAQFRTAIVDRRRYLPLRTATDDVLLQIRRMNEIAVAMRVGAMDGATANKEMDALEAKLHEMVSRLRVVAGVENAADGAA